MIILLNILNKSKLNSLCLVGMHMTAKRSLYVKIRCNNCEIKFSMQLGVRSLSFA